MTHSSPYGGDRFQMVIPEDELDDYDEFSSPLVGDRFQILYTKSINFIHITQEFLDLKLAMQHKNIKYPRQV